MPVGLVGFDKRQMGSADFLVGIDEAGRGCLAGPVVAAAVRCQREFYGASWCMRNSRIVDDSKRLNPVRRQAVISRFQYAVKKGWVRIGIGKASVEEIERYNIYHANSLAMRRALEKVIEPEGDPLWQDRERSPGNYRLLIDGKPIRLFPAIHTGVVKGDSKSLAIALAGIHAKEHRDSLIGQLHSEFPEYDFARHKGYGTRIHLDAIRRHGPCSLHRPSFLVKVIGGRHDKSTHSQDSLF